MKTKSLSFLVASTVILMATSACSSAPPKAAPAAPPATVVAMADQSQVSVKVDEKKSSEETVTCVLEKDKREVSVVAKDKGCEVNYTKAGKTSVVASDKAGMEHCEKTVAKMKGKLLAGGYKCD